MYKMIPYRRAHLSPMMPSLFNDPMMREFFNDSSNLPTMNVDVHEEENEYVLEADLPGIDKKDINLEVKDGVLTISADVNNEKKEEKKNYVYSERRCGHVERSFNLDGIDENGIKADYDIRSPSRSSGRIAPQVPSRTSVSRVFSSFSVRVRKSMFTSASSSLTTMSMLSVPMPVDSTVMRLPA